MNEGTMYTTTTGAQPSFEVETVDRVGEREVITRVTVEGLTSFQVAAAITEALARLTTHTGE